MLSWVKRCLGLGLRFLLRFFFRSFTRAMGCFLTCLRGRDHRRLPTSHTVSPESHSTDHLTSQEYDRELKDQLFLQANFLKACGTLVRTPAEIKKADKLEMSLSCGKDSEPSKFHSWLPSTSIEKLQLDVEPLNPPSPIMLCQEWGDATDSVQRTPSRNITGSLHTAARTEKIASSSVSPWLLTDTERKSKSVRFECDTDLSSCGSSSDDWPMKKSSQSTYKSSPYPTPLKLYDEMQTPGTDYPSTLEGLPYAKPRVRSQFVYPKSDPGENVFCCKILEDKDFSPEQDSRELSHSIDHAQNETPMPEKGLNKISHENEYNVEVSLSSSLKPASINEERNKSMETVHHEIPDLSNIADRPIIGAVAAHWNEHENSGIFPPKLRDCNGIPNTTRKYKEDQKVKWHATPFVERLEKALLSEDGSIPERKLVCAQPVLFDAIEESDGALSELQSATATRSVVSF